MPSHVHLAVPLADFLDSSSQLQTIMEGNEESSLVETIHTKSQAAKTQTEKIKVLFMSALDQWSAGLRELIETSDGNVTRSDSRTYDRKVLNSRLRLGAT